MERIGIIAEYNPFHNGHILHIQKIKEMYPNSIIILVLNGYFLERGEISFLTKEEKTKIALDYGIDLVVELPVFFGTQSADIFAEKAMTILNHFKVEKIVFGSELNDMDMLNKIVLQIMDENYQEKVQSLLKKGVNYPTALAKAIDSEINFNHPNDLLAISYIKAIKVNHYSITPISIQRTNSYHDLNSTESIVSASNIRYKLQNKEDISNYLPNSSKNAIHLPNQELFFYLLKTKILTTPHLENFLTVDEGIENRLQELMKDCSSLEEFIIQVKTKRYTYNKINRMLLHILLGITKEENQNASLTYIHILGFSKKGQEYLKTIKKEIGISTAIDKNSIVYRTEMIASLIYDIINNTNTYAFESKNCPIKK